MLISSFTWSVIKRFVTWANSICFSIRCGLHAVCSPQMTDRTNRHKSSNGEEWGSIENLREYGWWGMG